MWKGGIDDTALLSVYNILNRIALAILDRSSTFNDSFSVYVICRTNFDILKLILGYEA